MSSPLLNMCGSDRGSGDVAGTYGPELHIMEVIRQMDSFRGTSQLCDVTIRTGDGAELPAHRVILAAASPYFSALFGSCFSDSASGVHELPWISRSTAKDLLEFMYTGVVRISYEVVSELLAAAEYLILPTLKRHCGHFLGAVLADTNVCWVRHLANMYGLEELEKPIEVTFSKVSGAVLKDGHLLTLPAGAIRNLVFDPHIKHIREVDLVEFLLSWIRHDLDSRKDEIPNLLKCVLFSCLPDWYKTQLLQTDLIRDNIDDELRRSLQVTPAGGGEEEEGCGEGGDEENVIVMVTGYSDPPCVGYVPTQDRWVHFSKLMDMDLRGKSLKVVSLGRHLYLLVTMEDSMAWLAGSAAASCLPQVFFWRLDLDTDRWTQLCRPHSTSKCFHVLACAGHVFALGIMGTIERFDRDRGAWLLCQKPPRPFAYFDSILFADARYLYILNIYTDAFRTGDIRFCLQIYDNENDNWQKFNLACVERSLVHFSYRLPCRRSLCSRAKHTLQLLTLSGQRWAEIDLDNQTLCCFDAKRLLPTKVYADYGITVWLPDWDAIFVFNSLSLQCALYQCDTGFCKLTARCPSTIHRGQRTGCDVATISKSALSKMQFVST